TRVWSPSSLGNLYTWAATDPMRPEGSLYGRVDMDKQELPSAPQETSPPVPPTAAAMSAPPACANVKIPAQTFESEWFGRGSITDYRDLDRELRDGVGPKIVKACTSACAVGTCTSPDTCSFSG